ncbi:hypothetical protein CXB40_20490 [Pseudomonas syringae pv. avii]|uniref:Uncharacterized protein n=1 Tax=Pseudomonas syringae pv. tomato (strain ATCC BAA-871 / DC3000) TaxID=223283 RepID=Q887J5_PSESM|nr:protein of unknown function [Pseudomonas syringae pv. tomato str. DC3000]KPB79674.1 Uncharacterized protein AC505_4373 [Pseudomonas syringae pv. maculicola]KPB89431.1 Uncharacterized protein AC506_4325 [Pseudomonas syringae pv. maculicola str. M6]KPC05658.1 Uncharacterized protein AC500_3653 [Pseudomonas amygdali pv. lachrymans]MBW8021357.1 hypothetical protein [Pseudomonas syringae pv. tomato]MCF5226933.1 hypothetical protein [Pseudomonas syringae]POQ05738.1 hypothetical protein CXB40_204
MTRNAIKGRVCFAGSLLAARFFYRFTSLFFRDAIGDDLSRRAAA